MIGSNARAMNWVKNRFSQFYKQPHKQTNTKRPTRTLNISKPITLDTFETDAKTKYHNHINVEGRGLNEMNVASGMS